MEGYTIKEIRKFFLFPALITAFLCLASLSLALNADSGTMKGELGGGNTTTTQGELRGDLGTTISITIEGPIDWGLVKKGTGPITAEGGGIADDNEYTVTVEPTTNVPVDIGIWVENDTAPGGPYEGLYTNGLGPDNIIDVFEWYDNSDMSGTPVDVASTSKVSIPWLENLPAPEIEEDNYIDVPTITTSNNQVAGFYRGTITFEAVEHQ